MTVAGDLALVNAVDQLKEKDLLRQFMGKTEVETGELGNDPKIETAVVEALKEVGIGKETATENASGKENGIENASANEKESGNGSVETGKDLAVTIVGSAEVKTVNGNVVAGKKEKEVVTLNGKRWWTRFGGATKTDDHRARVRDQRALTTNG